jgi:uncharacterized protein (TIGR03089 family)
VTEVFTAALRRRNARSGATPLITYYDETRGERIELSGTSLGNWVDKTAGLLTDEIMVEPGDLVRLPIAVSHPAHWVTLIWVAAAWRARCSVTLGAADDAAVEVIGPDDPRPGNAETVACSLHPLGLGFSTPLPAGVIDYGVEVRAHPDSFSGPHPAPADPAWRDGNKDLSHADVVSGVAGGPARELITPLPDDTPLTIIRRALIRPVLTGGSAVIVLGASADRLAVIAAAENAAENAAAEHGSGSARDD